MLIVEAWLKKNNACTSGVKWFRTKYPNGENLQQVIDELVAERKDAWAAWLIRKAGDRKSVV